MKPIIRQEKEKVFETVNELTFLAFETADLLY
jgi:hypothetical protein